MAEVLYVLLRKEEHEGETLQEIHSDLINYDLFDNFSGVFDYFSYWIDSNTSFWGEKDPKRMQDVVGRWNPTMRQLEEEAEKEIKQMKEQQGVEFISQLEDTKDFVLWRFRQALCALNGHFTYGQNYLFYDEEHRWETYLPEEVEKEAIENPERFLIIEAFYH